MEQRSPRSLDEAEEEEKEDKMADSEDIESTDDSFNSNDTLNSKNESREFREQVDPFWSNKFGKDITPRYILQYMGTEVCRHNLLDSIWVDSLERKIHQHQNVVITDVRFNNEISFLKALGAKFIQVDRLDTRPEWYELYNTCIKTIPTEWDKFAKAKNIHTSEYEWIGNKDIDYVVENNSTIGDLKLKLSLIIED